MVSLVLLVDDVDVPSLPGTVAWVVLIVEVAVIVVVIVVPTIEVLDEAAFSPLGDKDFSNEIDERSGVVRGIVNAVVSSIGLCYIVLFSFTIYVIITSNHKLFIPQVFVRLHFIENYML